jgi:Icc-related predicted phosphoesterase
MVFGEIIRKKPSSLFLLGDVVSLGHKERTWTAVDTYLDSARKNNIPVYALLGNHDVMQRPSKGETNFQKRFPDHVRTGYVKTVDSISVVMLNSNFGCLSAEETRMQHNWLVSTLEKLDRDSSVKAVIVGCHHPPFTNSRLVRSSANVQEQFVKPYLNSKKGRLFITGHSHAFEYFKKEGKDFLIIGGGGGLNHPLNSGKNCHEDQCSSYKPMFHYLTVKLKGEELIVVSHRLKEDFSGFEDGFSLNLQVPRTYKAEMVVKE